MKTIMLLLFCATASAQTTYTYTGAAFNDGATGLTGSILLSAPLSANLNDQTVTPLSYVFGPSSSQFAQDYPATASFAFSTDAQGLIDGWNVSVSDASGGVVNEFFQSATSTQTGDTYSAYSLGENCSSVAPSPLCTAVQRTSFTAGRWVDPPKAAVEVPEIDPTGGFAAFLLWAFGIAVIRGRER